MTPLRRLTTLVMLCLLAAASVRPAYAAPGTRIYAAGAVFRSDTTTARPGDPCADSFLSISVEEHKTGSDVTAYIEVYLDEVDTCVTDDLVQYNSFYTFQALPADAYQFSRGGKLAVLDTTLTVCELSDDTHCLTIVFDDVTWVATGPASEVHGGRQWPATADGNITESGRDLAPTSSSVASLFKARH